LSQVQLPVDVGVHLPSLVARQAQALFVSTRARHDASGASQWLGGGLGMAGPPIWVTQIWPAAQGHALGGFGTHIQSVLSQWPMMQST
jgi:hypothetical protein